VTLQPRAYIGFKRMGEFVPITYTHEHRRFDKYSRVLNPSNAPVRVLL